MPEICNSLPLPALLSRNTDLAAAHCLLVDWSLLAHGSCDLHLSSSSDATTIEVLVKSGFSEFYMNFRCFPLVPDFDLLCRFIRNGMHSRMLTALMIEDRLL